MKKIFFDTEFTSLQKDTTLISIGFVCDDSCFYGVCTDYDESLVNDWVQVNVVNNLELNEEMRSLYDITEFTGTKTEVGKAFADWMMEKVSKDPKEKFELISDVCHYDMVLFIDMFGTAFDIPKNICPACYDINMDILGYLKNIRSSATLADAFDKNREELLIDIITDSDGSVSSEEWDTTWKELDPSCKHNALYDAIIIQQLYHHLQNRLT